MKKFIIILLVLGCFLPTFASAQIFPNGLIPCGQTDPVTHTVLKKDQCDFNDFLQLIYNIIWFLVYALAVPLATISILWAGILYVYSAQDPGKRNEAKKIIHAAIWGLVIALAAQLIVGSVLKLLIRPGAGVEIPVPQSFLRIETLYAQETENHDEEYYPGTTEDDDPPPAPAVPPPLPPTNVNFQILKWDSIEELIVGLVGLVLQVAWPLLIIAIIYVGFLFVAAQGNDGKLKEAKEAAKYTLIGAAIIVGAEVIMAGIKATIKSLGG